MRGGSSVFCENIGSVGHKQVRSLIQSAAKNVKPNTDDPYITPGPGKLFAATDNAFWSGTGTTVFYKPTAASGSFRVPSGKMMMRLP